MASVILPGRWPVGRQFKTVVADPPWPYKSAHWGFGATPSHGGNSGQVLRHYSVMSLDAIEALPVAEVMAVSSHLYLWITNSFMDEAHGVVRAWGFIPKTILTWRKVYPKNPTKVRTGLGYYFRGATEHIVFGVRGSLRTRTSVLNIFDAPVSRHSEKPECFMELVERCSPGPYLELFARSVRPGWTAWGNEV